MDDKITLRMLQNRLQRRYDELYDREMAEKARGEPGIGRAMLATRRDEVLLMANRNDVKIEQKEDTG